VSALGQQISQDYAGTEPVLVGVLKGVVPFMSDLMRHISLPLSVELMSVSYYHGDTQGVRITKDLDADIKGRHVLMVEDIVDTGMTLHYLLNYLQTRHPASLKVCTLLDKKVRRLVHVPIDYVGFEVSDEFLVGYGLDHRERYRNLPFIGVLRPDEAKVKTISTDKPKAGDRGAKRGPE
jgi:hypoxanthine phosphoribosyltransferase